MAETFAKRQKERARQEKQREKLERKKQRKLDKQNGIVSSDTDDFELERGLSEDGANEFPLEGEASPGVDE